ncbi:hypothetical protein ACIQGZ_27250 [Streptomyces sp. NPDC092296]|uniref:hypothetical protein n=1 Tax=Streptomyces sp. NPDC092296 TaxID=3366012 RepID=UPI00382242FA
MGIESDKLVYDYLGKVADLAQASLPPAQRARLIAGLRADIDQRRSGVRDTPAAVRKMLDRMGPPDRLVEQAARDGVPAPRGPVPPPPPAAAVPAPPAPPAGPPVPPVPSMPPTVPGASAPAVPTARDPEWWRLAAPAEGGDAALPTHLPTAADFPGWDGVEIDFDVPEKPAPPAPTEAAAPPPAPATEEQPPPKAAAPARPRRRMGRPPLLETLSALLLLGGAVAGSLVPMLLGWLAAYASRRIGPTARKFAALGIPALAVLGGAVWLWGRTSGKWGGPPPTDQQFQQAVKDLVPEVLRTAACGSAAFMAWCAYRRRTLPMSD